MVHWKNIDMYYVLYILCVYFCVLLCVGWLLLLLLLLLKCCHCLPIFNSITHDYGIYIYSIQFLSSSHYLYLYLYTLSKHHVYCVHCVYSYLKLLFMYIAHGLVYVWMFFFYFVSYLGWISQTDLHYLFLLTLSAWTLHFIYSYISIQHKFLWYLKNLYILEKAT